MYFPFEVIAYLDAKIGIVFNIFQRVITEGVDEMTEFSLPPYGHYIAFFRIKFHGPHISPIPQCFEIIFEDDMVFGSLNLPVQQAVIRKHSDSRFCSVGQVINMA